MRTVAIYAETVDPRRSLPSVERVVGAMAENDLPHALLVDCARSAIADKREQSPEFDFDEFDFDDLVATANHQAQAIRDARLRPLLNATGVLIHTNLGRSPLGTETFDAVRAIVVGYSNLEYQTVDGTRGSRHEHAGKLLARACGAEAGIVVNNNAAAVLLVLGALARGSQVVVSRGELVEIGGGFRVPEIMEESGCQLVEVGTTNRTRLSDYSESINNDTALILKVHASNYRMVGFTEATAVEELATLGPTVVVDAGSGLLDATTPWLDHRPAWLADEPGVRQALSAGAGVVTFSADKLLGGPQAGVIVGRADLIEQIARHPLARAMRADKVTLALLQQVALIYLSGDAHAIPIWRMATATTEELRVRAENIVVGLDGAKVVDTEAVAGGGSLPGLTIPSVGVAFGGTGTENESLLRRLRSESVVARVVDDAVVCDLRTIDPDDDTQLAQILARATQR